MIEFAFLGCKILLYKKPQSYPQLCGKTGDIYTDSNKVFHSQKDKQVLAFWQLSPFSTVLRLLLLNPIYCYYSMEVDDMRFSCDTSDLNSSLSIVSRALAVRSPKPILEGILFESCDEGLKLTCTDLALGIETVIPATFIEEGRAVLPGKLLCEIVRKLPGGMCDISISDRMQATIRCASIRTTITGFDPVEYPELPQVAGASFSMPQNTLRDMIGRTLFAIAVDESRPILTGCLMEVGKHEMRVVALDGFRLALRKETSKARIRMLRRLSAARCWAISRRSSAIPTKRFPCASAAAMCS